MPNNNLQLWALRWINLVHLGALSGQSNSTLDVLRLRMCILPPQFNIISSHCVAQFAEIVHIFHRTAISLIPAISFPLVHLMHGMQQIYGIGTDTETSASIQCCHIDRSICRSYQCDANVIQMWKSGDSCRTISATTNRRKKKQNHHLQLVTANTFIVLSSSTTPTMNFVVQNKCQDRIWHLVYQNFRDSHRCARQWNLYGLIWI